MQPKFDQYHEGYGAEPLCPSCGGNYLRHESVEVFEREGDQANGVHVSVGEGNAKINTDLSRNPSARRHGLSIHFSCEHCSAKPVLHVSQHKGNTIVDFVAVA